MSIDKNLPDMNSLINKAETLTSKLDRKFLWFRSSVENQLNAVIDQIATNVLSSNVPEET